MHVFGDHHQRAHHSVARRCTPAARLARRRPWRLAPLRPLDDAIAAAQGARLLQLQLDTKVSPCSVDTSSACVVVSTSMAIKLNHTIVHSNDKRAAAQLFVDLF